MFIHKSCTVFSKAKVELRAQLQNPFLSAKLFTVIGSVENTLED